MIRVLEKTKVGKEDRKWGGTDILDRASRKSLRKKVYTVLKKVRERVAAVSERTVLTEEITSTKPQGRRMPGTLEDQSQCRWAGAQ